MRRMIDAALRCKATGEKKVLCFHLSGHGHFDLSAYAAFEGDPSSRYRNRIRAT